MRNLLPADSPSRDKGALDADGSLTLLHVAALNLSALRDPILHRSPGVTRPRVRTSRPQTIRLGRGRH